jgi:hypothetical protein
MVSEENSFYRRSATDAVERLSKRARTESTNAGRAGIDKSQFGKQDYYILSFPVIEWDDYGDETCYNSSYSEDDDEVLCRDTAKLQVSPAATGGRPRSPSHLQASPESAKACRLVRSKAFLSHLSLLESGKPSAHYGNLLP